MTQGPLFCFCFFFVALVVVVFSYRFLAALVKMWVAKPVEKVLMALLVVAAKQVASR